MNQKYSPEFLAQFANGERFLIVHKRKFMLASFIISFIVTAIILGPPQHVGVRKGPQSSQVQTAHALGLAMYAYAGDHDGHYPPGNSSTEGFQHLIDEEYISDPSIFFFPMKGKCKATSKHLMPKNVCWDVTGALTTSDPQELPLVFATGYRIEYQPNGTARDLGVNDFGGLSVFYVNKSARFLRADNAGIPVISATFDPKGTTYRQLTPDGPLP